MKFMYLNCRLKQIFKCMIITVFSSTCNVISSSKKGLSHRRGQGSIPVQAFLATTQVALKAARIIH